MKLGLYTVKDRPAVRADSAVGRWVARREREIVGRAVTPTGDEYLIITESLNQLLRAAARIVRDSGDGPGSGSTAYVLALRALDAAEDADDDQAVAAAQIALAVAEAAARAEGMGSAELQTLRAYRR